MATTQRSTQLPRLSFIICASSVLLLVFLTQASNQTHQQQSSRNRRDIMDSTEVPAENIDPAAIDLTPLVNTLINSSQSGSHQLFSLLSVTSHSSLALHRLTLLVYNISSIRILESNMFRRRFCYCVTNETNDLTDFTAILLDVVGNSTTYLHELFKSASILSVSQRNSSDCIYICVMAGKMGRELPELWDVDSITPLFNQTIIEGPSRGNVSSIKVPLATTQQPPTAFGQPSRATAAWTTDRTTATSQLVATVPVTARVTSPTQPAAVTPSTESGEPETSAPAWSPTTRRPPPSTTQMSTATTQTTLFTIHPTRPSPARSTSPPTTATKTLEMEKAGCPWRRSELDDSSVSISSSSTTVSAHKLQPCVLELCKFFSQCLCRPLDTKTQMKRYCDDSHVWYEKHTLEVCRRVRRLSFSRNLKQRCLAKMCNKL